ncbi:hypothetical protein EV294_1303 [Paenibacillus sp. BK033]|uniref:hypothetical protein n=1 Tax=Paenibacillus sp. BK033 TaxID=2512133 RepID=UPI00104C4D32|nr:hypothetical protein [Paenibacillus sp. BK033]TCM84916.1 hypothetical protein EV294_1303 [Paenibacillus sp. BK033]
MGRISILTTLIACWIIVLLIEIFKFNNTIHEVHTPDDTLFAITLIAITLIVGVVSIIVAAFVSPKNH